MRQVCYGIVGKTKMYMSVMCVCEDADALQSELEDAQDGEPEEDYRIEPLYAQEFTPVNSEEDQNA